MASLVRCCARGGSARVAGRRFSNPPSQPAKSEMATTAMQVSRLIASPPIGSCSGPTFSNTTMLLEAAAAGQGVALAGHVLVAGDIAQGKLVRPFGECAGTPLRLAYHLVYRPGAPVRNPRLAALRQWLMAEAAQHEATRLANRAEGSEGVMAGEDAT